MTKKYRLLRALGDIPEGTIYYLSEGMYWSKHTERFTVLPESVVESIPEVFEPIQELAWMPENREIYFFIYEWEEIFNNSFDNSSINLKRFAFGNCFRTKEQAEEACKRVKKVLWDYQEELRERNND